MTGTAIVRFYAELNDFLPSDRRQRDIPFAFHVAPSVKDAIEGLGVPHTEVDLILVDGQPAGFDHRLDDGERISVYPTFERFDVSGVTLTRPEPLREVRFVADGHLATLARWLRLLGFDARCEVGWSDDELVEVSVNEHRILLTRDRGVLKRRSVTHGLYVRDDDPDEQLVDVVRHLHLGRRLQPFTRCMVCNGLLDDVEKDIIADRLAPRTRAAFESFRRCPGCGRVYWQGAHHRRLLDLVERARTEDGCGR